MNGTTLRFASAVACVAALAAPSAALAKKHHAHRTATKQIIEVPHTYDAGGNGIELTTPAAGQRINLFDAVGVAVSLGNNVLGGLGLPPVQLPGA